MANECFKKCAASLSTKEMQITTTLRFHLTLVRLVVIKKKNKQGAREVAQWLGACTCNVNSNCS